jgi:hypothetical protein
MPYNLIQAISSVKLSNYWVMRKQTIPLTVFIYGLFNNAVRIYCVKHRMNREQWIGKDRKVAAVSNFGYYSRIFSKGLTKTINLSLGGRLRAKIRIWDLPNTKW